MSQWKCTLETLEENGMLNYKYVDTSMDLNVKLDSRRGKPFKDIDRY